MKFPMPPLVILSVRRAVIMSSPHRAHQYPAEFRLYPGNHSVARSDFRTPCLPYEYTGSNRQGFFSGFIGPQVITNDVSSVHFCFGDHDTYRMPYSFLSFKYELTIRSQYSSTVRLRGPVSNTR